jgi:pyridinium-3,5-bisthiocarboxylic acid mononucleotide nickel chelatase
VLLHESSTLGVRIAQEERLELPRRLATVHTAYGPIQVKVAVRPDGTLRAVPEYESVRSAAAAAGVPLGDVYRAALQAEWDGGSGS